MIKSKHKNKIVNMESGLALVEVIAALGVAVIVITALVSLSISTLRTSLNSKLLQMGSDVANREIELVRAFRDNTPTWSAFITEMMGCTSTTGCHMKSDLTKVVGKCTQTSVSDEDCNSTSIEAVSRSFRATDAAGGNVKVDTKVVRVSVSVTWKVGAENKGTYIYTDLTNWRSQ